MTVDLPISKLSTRRRGREQAIPCTLSPLTWWVTDCMNDENFFIGILAFDHHHTALGVKAFARFLLSVSNASAAGT